MRIGWQKLTSWLHLEPLLAVVLWGGVYPGAKLGLRDIPVLSFTALRILVAVAVLMVVSGGATAWPLPRPLWYPLLRAGLAQTVFQVLLIASLRWTTAGNSAILLATAPLLTAAWLACRRREPPGQQQGWGLLIGVIGVGFVVQGGGLGITWSRLGGDLLALGAAGVWVWYSLLIGPLVGTLGAVRATAWTMLVAACSFTPLAFAEMRAQSWSSVSWEAWAGLLYGATVGMVLAMTLWGRAVHRFGPKRTMVYVYLEPLSALILAALLLGEAFHPLHAVGALLALVGVGLVSSS